jgi:hypothetical protein
MSAKDHVSNVQIEELHHTLKRTNLLLYRQNSLPYSFILAAVRGVGYAFGATLVAGIVIALMVRIFQTVELLPLLDQYIDTSQF